MNMRTADLVTSLVLITLGFAMVWGGFVMDRLEIRGIHPASIPGLVPMGLGVAIILCGALLLATSYGSVVREVINFGDVQLLIWTGVLCSAFALLLVGRIPFFWASFIFISAATARFRWQSHVNLAVNGRQVMFALGSGLVFSGLITLLFRDMFLVRLP
mgnify:FL=1|jgi:putative tricarboxylic transport membrane protein